MKSKFILIISLVFFSLLFILGAFLFSNLFNQEVSEGVLENSSTLVVFEDSEINLARQDNISVEKTYLGISKEYEMDYTRESGFFQVGDPINTLKFRGLLINPDNAINDLKIQFKFYNSNFEDQPVRYVEGIEDPSLPTITNQWVSFNKNLIYEGNSKNNFPVGATPIDFEMSNIPLWYNSERYEYSNVLEGWEWAAGNYDIDRLEVSLYSGDTKIYFEEWIAPSKYILDSNFSLDRLEPVVRGHRLYFDAITFTTSSEEGLGEPSIHFDIKKITPPSIGNNVVIEDYKMFELDVPFEEIPSGVNSYRVPFSESIDFLSVTPEPVGYIVYVRGLSHGKIFDENSFYFSCIDGSCDQSRENEKFSEYKNSGYSLEVLGTYGGVKGENLGGVEVQIKIDEHKEEMLKIQFPVLEVICGNYMIYPIEGDIEEIQYLDFIEGANCFNPLVHLRDGYSPLVYAYGT